MPEKTTIPKSMEAAVGSKNAATCPKAGFWNPGPDEQF
jgi:hypothetical protein